MCSSRAAFICFVCCPRHQTSRCIAAMEASRERSDALESLSVPHVASPLRLLPPDIASFCGRSIGGAALEKRWSIFVTEVKELAKLSDSDCAMLRVSLDPKCSNRVTANALVHFLGAFGGLPLDHSDQSTRVPESKARCQFATQRIHQRQLRCHECQTALSGLIISCKANEKRANWLAFE